MRHSPGRRRWVMAGLCTLAGAARATPPPPGASRAAPATGPAELPVRMLRVEFRCVPDVGAGEAGPAEAGPAVAKGDRRIGTAGVAPPAPGSVVAGTRERRDAGPTVAWRSSTARPQAAPSVLRVQVLNGQLARWAVQREMHEPVLDFVWIGGPRQSATGAASTSGSGSTAGIPSGIGVALREQAQHTLQELQVLPRWPGGAQPVQVWLSAHRSGPHEADGRPGSVGRASLETTLHLPPGRWVPVAHSVGGEAGGSARAGAPAGCTWQLRVTPEPE